MLAKVSQDLATPRTSFFLWPIGIPLPRKNLKAETFRREQRVKWISTRITRRAALVLLAKTSKQHVAFSASVALKAFARHADRAWPCRA